MLQLQSVFDGSFTLDAAKSVVADEFGFAPATSAANR